MIDMTFAETLIARALNQIANDPQAIGRVLNHLDSSMPNIEAPTMGGEVFWHTIYNVDG